MVSDINRHVGQRMRKYRLAAGMTLQKLSEEIHKSRATVCKYENGEISIDIATMYEICQALQISVGKLTGFDDFSVSVREKELTSSFQVRKSPFFQADRLYFYFYDGRYNRMKDGIIDIHQSEEMTGSCPATFSICSVTGNGRSSEIYYTGNVLYSDMLIRFSFVNQCNPLEEDLLYIFNPLEFRTLTDGLLCGISSADLMPCAFKCLVSLEQMELTEELRQRLLFTKEDIRRWKKLNMLLIDTRSETWI